MKKNWGSFSFTHRNTFAPLFTHKHSLTIKWNSWEPNDKNLYRANQRKVCKYSRRLKNVHNTMQNVWECEKSGQSVCSMYTVYGKLFEYPENIAWNILSHSATHLIFHFWCHNKYNQKWYLFNIRKVSLRNQMEIYLFRCFSLITDILL